MFGSGLGQEARQDGEHGRVRAALPAALRARPAAHRPLARRQRQENQENRRQGSQVVVSTHHRCRGQVMPAAALPQRRASWLTVDTLVTSVVLNDATMLFVDTVVTCHCGNMLFGNASNDDVMLILVCAVSS